jgi:hypothetical protein
MVLEISALGWLQNAALSDMNKDVDMQKLTRPTDQACRVLSQPCLHQTPPRTNCEASIHGFFRLWRASANLVRRDRREDRTATFDAPVPVPLCICSAPVQSVLAISHAPVDPPTNVRKRDSETMAIIKQCRRRGLHPSSHPFAGPLARQRVPKFFSHVSTFRDGMEKAICFSTHP